MRTPQPLNLGSMPSRLRAEAGLSQEDVAERAGMSAAAISALERGVRRAPYRETVALPVAAQAIDEAADTCPLTGHPAPHGPPGLSDSKGRLSALQRIQRALLVPGRWIRDQLSRRGKRDRRTFVRLTTTVTAYATSGPRRGTR